MNLDQFWVDLAAVLASASPLILATLGETITERAGVINLSLDGTMLLAAMVGFAVGFQSQNVGLGLLAAALVGGFIGLILGFLSLSLRQSQTAVGFVLALLCTDLSSFLGNAYVRVPGVAVPSMPIPFLKDLPILGKLFFHHDLIVYSSFILTPALSWFLFQTRNGLILRALGEQPTAAFARGINVIQYRYFYTILGGMLVGLAGAAYSLDLKQGWSHRHIAGMGWIALAIVIFGAWQPWRVAFGCYLFSALQVLASRSQSLWPSVPTQVFQVAPFALMLGFLVLVNLSNKPPSTPREAQISLRWLSLAKLMLLMQGLLHSLAASPPAALGKPFYNDEP